MSKQRTTRAVKAVTSKPSKQAGSNLHASSRSTGPWSAREPGQFPEKTPEIGQPTLRTLNMDGLKTLFPAPPRAKNESAPKAQTRRRTIERRRLVTVRNTARAAAQIGPLPEIGEAVSMLLAPLAFDAFAILPALIELAQEPADEVLLLTFSMNERHLLALEEMADRGDFKTVTLVISDYWRNTDRKVYGLAADIFARRKWPIAVARNHCKIIAARFGSRCFVCHGSANLRTSRNTENAQLEQSPALFDMFRDYAQHVLGGTDGGQT